MLVLKDVDFDRSPAKVTVIIMESSRSRCSVAIRIVVEGWRAARAGEGATHRADLVDAVIIRLSRRTWRKFPFRMIFTCRHATRIMRLADLGTAPNVRCGSRCPATSWCVYDRGAPPQTIVTEGRRLAGLRRIGDPDEPVLGIPAVISLPV